MTRGGVGAAQMERGARNPGTTGGAGAAPPPARKDVRFRAGTGETANGSRAAAGNRGWTGMSTPRSRLLFALAALLLVPAFFLPLWSVTLRAPQYPEGLGMHIHVNQVVGHDPHDLQNINILNHYIGMQPIEPDAIPELVYMPWILGALVGLGLVAALAGRRWMLAGWLGLLVVAGAVGLADFFSWKVEYGHNLSPDAPIKVPGMTYTPPFIGSKQLLNITATSWPSWGSLFLGLSVAVAAATLWRSRRQGRRLAALSVALAALLLPVAGCGPAEDDAVAGTERSVATRSAAAENRSWGEVGDAAARGERADRLEAGAHVCAFCGEAVGVDHWAAERYGGELVTRDGEVRHFMSIECLAGFLLQRGFDPQDIVSVRVVDFGPGNRLIDARFAIYLKSPNRSSPMGLNILAVGDARLADNLKWAYPGELMDWDAVLADVAATWEL